MEALAGVTAALLCIYDLTKGLDRGAIIGEIRLRHKEGGKSGVWRDDGVKEEAGAGQPQPEQKALCGLLAAVLTVSDSCAVDESRDLSGKIIADFLREQRAEVVEAQIVPDEIKQIRAAVERFALQEKTELVLVTGGTGLGPRDVTPEALAPLWSKTLPGFGEQFRIFGTKNDARAWLSRAEAGMVGNAIVILLPGSPSGVRDGLQVIKANLPHMLAMARGGKH